MGAAIGAGIGAAGAIGGSILSAVGARKKIDEMKKAIEYQKQTDATNTSNFSPYMDFGKDSLNKFSDWMGSPESDPMSFMDPGFQFRKDQGMDTLTSNAATAGMLKSGDTLRAATQLGDNMASQEYSNAFGRRMAEGDFQRANIGIGSNATSNLGGLLNQGANNVGQLTTNTDFGAPEQIWGNTVAGIGGMGGNAFARGMAPGTAPSGGMAPAVMPSNPNGIKWPF